MQTSKRVALFFAAEIPLVTVPMVIPSISTSTGFGLWLLAFVLLIYASSEFWAMLPPLRSARKPEWLPLPHALRYLVLDSQWGHAQTPKTHADAEQRIMREVLEAAAQGAIEVRGLNTGHSWRNAGKQANASEPIPVEFWTHAFFQPFGEIYQNDPARAAAATEGSMPTDDRRSYQEVVIRTSDLQKRWPRLKSRKKQPNLMAVAYRDWARDAERNPELELDLELNRILGGA